MDKPAATKQTTSSSSNSNRKEKRMKWWAQYKQKREEKREGLRKLIPEDKQTVNPSALVEQNNKGGFRTSVATRNALAQTTVVPGKMKVEMKSQTKLNFKTVKSNSENSKKNNNKVKEEIKVQLPNVHIAGEQTSSKHMVKSYVLFVGNLPFDISKEQLEEHFRKTGGVKTIRIPKEKGTDKARGFAYIEFKDRISHGIALRLHQTTLGGRKINVEFTSIGGKNKKRLDKLKMKNLAKAKFKVPLEH